VFDFNQPNFYLNFARGFLYYKLGVSYYQDFKDAYIYYNRFIHEQTLSLTHAQRQKLYNFLVWNSRPENQTYRYDYYHNNCATKIRDVLTEQLGSDIKWDSTFLKSEQSFRQKTNDYLDPLPWGDLGIDICLGLPIDRKMSAYEYMFLPDYIEQFVAKAKVKNDSSVVALTSETKVVFASQPVEATTNFVHPWVAFGGLFLIVTTISWRDWKRKKLSKWLDVILFSTCGLIGVLLISLWAFTDHHDAAKNFNLLWAFPLHLVGAIALLSKRLRAIVVPYFTFVDITTGILIFFWMALPQELNPFLWPIWLALLLRASLISTFLKKEFINNK
jgi:drug/metabolite transporter superfamily protein YnfA